jgi:hypothetical protein
MSLGASLGTSALTRLEGRRTWQFRSGTAHAERCFHRRGSSTTGRLERPRGFESWFYVLNGKDPGGLAVAIWRSGADDGGGKRRAEDDSALHLPQTITPTSPLKRQGFWLKGLFVIGLNSMTFTVGILLSFTD